MNAHDIAVVQNRRMLVQLDAWIAAAIAYAEARPFDPAVLLTARLAPDQYPFTRQVQTACDNAKFAVARLAGQEAPRHADTETTIDELRERIRKVIAYLDAARPGDFLDADTREVTLPWAPDRTMSGLDYLLTMAQPNFYFHVCMAYAILRHNGVPLGKFDFLGPINLRARSA